MHFKRNTVLGISISTSYLGIGLLSNGNLEDWCIKSFNNAWSKLKLRIMLLWIARYVEKHSVVKIALKIPHPSRSSPALEQLIAGITELAGKSKIEICTYTIERLIHSCGTDGIGTKVALIESLKKSYPELLAISEKQLRNRREYYMKVFEAIAAAECCIRQK